MKHTVVWELTPYSVFLRFCFGGFLGFLSFLGFCFGILILVFWFFDFCFLFLFSFSFCDFVILTVVAYCTQLLSQTIYNLMMATMAETCSC